MDINAQLQALAVQAFTRLMADASRVNWANVITDPNVIAAYAVIAAAVRANTEASRG